MNTMNSEILENTEQLELFINNTKNNLNETLKTQKFYRTILLKYITKISTYPINFLSNKPDTFIIDFLTDLKNHLDLSNTNIFNLEKLQKNFENLNISFNIEEIQKIVNDFIETRNEININTEKIETFISNAIDISDFTFNKTDIQKRENLNYSIPTTENTSNFVESNPFKTENTQNLVEQPEISQNTEQNNIELYTNPSNSENTLLISEMQNKVVFPYTYNELNTIWENNKEKYSNIEQIIEDKYTKPYSNFKNPIFSRFKGAYNLVKNVEHKSIIEAFDLAFELMFNYNVHPAIIWACKNLDQLDIYLSYLETNELEKFDFFKIKFEIAPTIKK